MCKKLGIPHEVMNSEIMRFHWASVLDWVAEMQAQGKPVPEELTTDRDYVIYVLTCRAAKDVDLDSLAARINGENEDE